jgi:hypothetical protein
MAPNEASSDLTNVADRPSLHLAPEQPFRQTTRPAIDQRRERPLKTRRFNSHVPRRAVARADQFPPRPFFAYVI